MNAKMAMMQYRLAAFRGRAFKDVLGFGPSWMEAIQYLGPITKPAFYLYLEAYKSSIRAIAKRDLRLALERHKYPTPLPLP